MALDESNGLDEMLDAHFDIEYSEEYGYLNSNIKNLGNATTIRINLNETLVA